MYFIHNILCILFTIYTVLYSQYMMYFIHNIWCTSFTIYDVFYSQYIIILFTIYYVFYSKYILYFIHNIVNKIRHKRCSAFAPFLYILNYSVSSRNYLFSCSPALSLHTKTNRQAWKPHICSFFKFSFLVYCEMRQRTSWPDRRLLVDLESVLSTKAADSLQRDNCTPYSALTSTLHASL
jgi:hypothetical protein